MTGKIKPFALLMIATAGLVSFGCGANQGVLKSGKENAQPTSTASPKSAFESDMDAMKTAGFSFVYVLRRKDSGKLDAADRSLIKAQTTDTNRRVATDEDRAVMIGSNAQLPDANLNALRERFNIDITAEPPPANTNANANQAK
jgi:hypothetical protein